MQERSPLGEAQIGSDDRRLLLVPLVHQRKELADLRGLDFDVTDFIDDEAVVGRITLEQLAVATIGQRLEEFLEQLGEGDEVAAMAAINGLQQEGGGQAGLAAAGRPQPDHAPPLGHVVEAVVVGHDLVAIEFGLPLEGKGFHFQHFRNVGSLPTQEPCVLALGSAFFLHDVTQQSLGRVTPLPGVIQVSSQWERSERAAGT